MLGKIKKFNKKLYDIYDTSAREFTKQKLGEFNVQDNPDIYAEDLLIVDPTCAYTHIELQVCAKWDKEYPHPLPYVYERKGHFSDRTVYIIYNKYLSRCLIFDRSALHDKPVREKKFSRTYIYRAPWNKVLRLDDTHYLDMQYISSLNPWLKPITNDEE